MSILMIALHITIAVNVLVTCILAALLVLAARREFAISRKLELAKSPSASTRNPRANARHSNDATH